MRIQKLTTAPFFSIHCECITLSRSWPMISCLTFIWRTTKRANGACRVKISDKHSYVRYDGNWKISDTAQRDVLWEAAVRFTARSCGFFKQGTPWPCDVGPLYSWMSFIRRNLSRSNSCNTGNWLRAPTAGLEEGETSPWAAEHTDVAILLQAGWLAGDRCLTHGKSRAISVNSFFANVWVLAALKFLVFRPFDSLGQISVTRENFSERWLDALRWTNCLFRWAKRLAARL